MSKLIINPDEQLTFNVEIKLSVAQLKYLCKREGDDDLSTLVDLMSMNNVEYGVVTSNPSFDLGLGADINDLLSQGFLFESHVFGKEINYELNHDNVYYNPFRIKTWDIKKIDAELIDCEINTDYVPITQALDNDGNVIDINDFK